MNYNRSAFSFGSLILGLSLVSALCRADIPARPAHGPDQPAAYSAAAFYNLGNAYAREGKPALSVLNYERARLLAPQDPDIRANLQHERDLSSLPAASKGWEGNFRIMSPNATYWFGLAGLVMAGASGILLALRKVPRVVAGAALGAGLLMVAYTLMDAAAVTRVMHEAVVMQSTPAGASPIGNAEALFTLSPATVVQVQDAHGDFLLVRDGQGSTGWVPRSHVTPVI
jgi:hypothetical protein